MTLTTSQDPYMRFGRAGKDTVGVLRQTIRKTFDFRGTALVEKLGDLPYRGIVVYAAALVEVAHDGTSPTVTVGTYDSANEVIDADALIDNADVDLTSTGLTSVTDKLGYRAADDHEQIVATFAASAAPTEGRVTLLLEFINAENNG